MQPSDLVLRFISSIGGPREALYYLSLFRSERPESFALICVPDAILHEAIGALVMDLRFLAQLGLTPVLVLGMSVPAGDPVHGQQDGEAHGHAPGAARIRAQADKLARRLLPEVRCEILAAPDAAGQARTAARAGAIAVVLADTLPPASTAGGAADAHGFAGLSALASALATRKIVFLDRQSGLQPREGPVPSLVDITTEYEALRATLPAEHAALLGHIRELIHEVSHRITVTVTSPLDLLRELFTTSGAGTLIRRGSLITRHRHYDTLDRARVRRLLERAFDKPLAEGFFEREADSTIYAADDVRGLAIVDKSPYGPYLSKFAVDRQAQGEGVGRDLWRALTADCSTLLWRSRIDNPITAWYRQQCDGMVRTGRWLVFWRGLSVDRVAEAVRYADGMPPDFTHAPARSA